MSLNSIKKRYEGKGRLIVNFAFFYALIALLLTLAFRYLPGGVSLENQLFDKIQQQVAIDSKGDYMYNRFAPHLEDLLLINLDSTFFDKETDRINKKQLAHLLDKLSLADVPIQCLFLDYVYGYASEDDSLLISKLELFQDKLVSPMNLEVKGELALAGRDSELTKSKITGVQKPIHTIGTTGYAYTFVDPTTYSNRYFKYKFDDNSYFSVPWLMYERAEKTDKVYLKERANNLHEIRYVLRNKEVEGKERAILVYDGNAIIDQRMPRDYLKESMKDKVVIVGLFDDYKTKYLNPIDKLITPVQPDMSGALVLVNAYLNLVARLDYKPYNWWILFVLNFLVGVLITLNYEKNIKSKYVSLVTLLFNLIISIFIFNAIALFFFIVMNVKLALGISLLLYQNKYYLFSWFQAWYYEKNDL